MSGKIGLIIRQWPSVPDADTQPLGWSAEDAMLLVDPAQCAADQYGAAPASTIVLENADPERDGAWLARQSCQWVCGEGIERTVELREQWPDLAWVPRLEVFRPQKSYHFSGPAIGEGFSFYIPDTSAIKGWRVTDGDILLSEAVDRLKELNFTKLWLHSLDADSKNTGLDLEMLDRIQDSGLDIWISGGLSEPRHLANLAKYGGASNVIVDADFIRAHGIDLLVRALTPQDAGSQTVPAVDFSIRKPDETV